MGFVSFFENFIQITVLLFAWAIVLISFFVLAIQLFVSLIEFKLSTLCGFVLIPFGLFGKTAFAAERGARQCHLLRRESARARRHRGHRLDAVFTIHHVLSRDAHNRGCDGAGACVTVHCSASASSALGLRTASSLAARNLAPVPRSAPALRRAALPPRQPPESGLAAGGAGAAIAGRRTRRRVAGRCIGRRVPGGVRWARAP